MTPEHPYALDKRQLAAAFAAAASQYDRHAVLQRLIAERLDERLDLFTLNPAWVIDVGAGTGYGTRLLRRRFRRATVIALDLAPEMLHAARRAAPRFLSRERYVCGDAESLPLASASVDLIFCCLTLQWCNDLDAVFREVRRVLRPEGLFTFATLGPDTLRELRASWASLDERPHVHVFTDMHDVGDALIRAGLAGPVLDVEHLKLTYPDVSALLRDLQALGATNAARGRHRGLTGKSRLAALARNYEQWRAEGLLPATYEVVYGHAFAPTQDARPQDGSTVATFPLAALRARRPPKVS